MVASSYARKYSGLHLRGASIVQKGSERQSAHSGSHCTCVLGQPCDTVGFMTFVYIKYEILFFFFESVRLFVFFRKCEMYFGIVGVVCSIN